MEYEEKIIQRLDELIGLGEDVSQTQRSTSVIGGDDYVDAQLSYQWATSSQNLLAKVFGKESEHYKNFSKELDSYMSYSPAYRSVGILKAAKDDFENGYLFDVKQVIEADVFDDFISQATALFDSGYYQASAVIAGAVLEDGLRKLCENIEIELPDKPKLDFMNSQLAKAGIYKKLTQKKITALADIRNNAAHGKWDEFTKDDVSDAIKWIQSFMESNYA